MKFNINKLGLYQNCDSFKEHFGFEVGLGTRGNGMCYLVIYDGLGGKFIGFDLWGMTKFWK